MTKDMIQNNYVYEH